MKLEICGLRRCVCVCMSSFEAVMYPYLYLSIIPTQMHIFILFVRIVLTAHNYVNLCGWLVFPYKYRKFVAKQFANVH